MSSESDSSIPPSPTGRRASYAPGQKLTDFFGRQPPNNNTAGAISAYPGPIVAAAANAQAHQRRRMSISTLGLSGSPNQTSPFAVKQRQNSMSSNGSGSPSTDESAIDESGDAANPAPSTPFARRMSFGARAMRDVRGGGTGSFNGRPPTTSTSPQSTKARGLSLVPGQVEEEVVPFPSVSNTFSRRTGEGGFNWSDQIRSRAERSASIAGSPGTTASPNHHRAATVAAEAPIKEMPKAPKAPDHFQERILKGDFYMD